MEPDEAWMSRPLCEDCSYHEPGNICSRKKGCYIIPAIVRLEKILSA